MCKIIKVPKGSYLMVQSDKNSYNTFLQPLYTIGNNWLALTLSCKTLLFQISEGIFS